MTPSEIFKKIKKKTRLSNFLLFFILSLFFDRFN
jgi:hypothetical protein